MTERLSYADLALMMLVVAIAAMLIIPLPTLLLDLLLVMNLSFAILLLVVGLYVGHSGALYTFPSILLLSTLFRLGLNVASSRLILSQGDAGRVIEAFGVFLIRGEIVVGLIIFSIVTVVNFIVISSGANRVSEVAAKFALDALPGKQMMIDNDARAGIISAEEARRKRDDLRRESQLYGSMDGAMKFVQGDAIAGLFIILVNIVGGVYLGLQGGMSLKDALHTYTILTVGDGLVTQIPSLLTSICAGIIVTRVASSETSSLSSDLSDQLFAQPSTLFITSFILTGMALVPGLPLLPFLLSALGFGVAGVWVKQYGRQGASIDSGADSERSERVTGFVDAETGDTRLILELDMAILHKEYRARGTEHMTRWREFRDEFRDDTGITLPPLFVQGARLAPPASYRVRYQGVEMMMGDVPPNCILVEMSSCQADLLGLKVVRDEDHPRSGHRVFWIEQSPYAIRMLDEASITYYSFVEFIARRIGHFCLHHPEEFISVTFVHSQLRLIEKKYPGLIADGFGREFVSVPKLTEVLQELVRQGVSIRDFRSILESLAAYCAASGITLDGATPVDIAEAVHFVRANRRRQIVKRFVGDISALPIITLSPAVEQNFEEMHADRWSTTLAMAPDIYDHLLQGIHQLLRPARAMGTLPIALLCSREVKEKVISFARMSGLNVFVTTLDEVDPSFPVMQIGVWHIRG